MKSGKRIDELLNEIECYSVLEMGCGFGNRLLQTQSIFRCGIDIFFPYLRDSDCNVHLINADIRNIPFKLNSVDVVMFIDAIEHIEKQEALKCLAEAEGIARKKIVIFAPRGDDPLIYDAWGYGNDYHQTHKSTWDVDDFTRLGYEVVVLHEYHRKDKRVFDAIWAIKHLTHPQVDSL